LVNRTFFGLGTLINMVLPGYVIDFFQTKINELHLSMFSGKILVFF